MRIEGKCGRKSFPTNGVGMEIGVGRAWKWVRVREGNTEDSACTLVPATPLPQAAERGMRRFAPSPKAEVVLQEGRHTASRVTDQANGHKQPGGVVAHTQGTSDHIGLLPVCSPTSTSYCVLLPHLESYHQILNILATF